MNFQTPIHAQLPTDESTLFEGDAFALVSRLPERSLNLVLTSPPYNIGKEYERGMFQSLASYETAMGDLISSLEKKISSEGSVCWQVGNHVDKGVVTPLDFLFFNIFTKNGFKLRNRIIWRFNFGLNSKSRFSGRYETVLWFTKSDKYTFNLDPVRVPQIYPGKRKKTRAGYLPSGNPKGKNPSDFWEFDASEAFGEGAVWDFPNVKANHPEKADHPCQFPNEMADRCIIALTNKGDVVLDPFAGVGTTVTCATARGRVGIGFELVSKYYDEAMSRLELAKHDVLPKVPPLISRVRGCHGAHPGGVAQVAWQHRRASARLSRYAVAHGCNRRASCTAPTGHG